VVTWLKRYVAGDITSETHTHIRVHSRMCIRAFLYFATALPLAPLCSFSLTYFFLIFPPPLPPTHPLSLSLSHYRPSSFISFSISSSFSSRAVGLKRRLRPNGSIARQLCVLFLPLPLSQLLSLSLSLSLFMTTAFEATRRRGSLDLKALFLSSEEGGMRERQKGFIA
jgi:hypothetical protein